LHTFLSDQTRTLARRKGSVDDVGVKAVDDWTLLVELEHPTLFWSMAFSLLTGQS
jgi:ABC-type oligopeptide transport system substrate-binding subunit